MNNSKKITLLLLVAIATSFTFKNTSGYSIGDTVEDFQLKNIDDSMVSLTDFSNAKGFVIIFTCNTCPYSVANEDRIIALDNKYKQQGYPVIAINPNDPAVSKGDDFEAMKIRAKDKNFTFPYLFDEQQEVYQRFGATKTPHVFIVSKNTMKVVYIGAIDNSSRDENAVTERYVENALEALIANKEIEKTTTKAIGCSIKTKK